MLEVVRPGAEVAQQEVPQLWAGDGVELDPVHDVLVMGWSHKTVQVQVQVQVQKATVYSVYSTALNYGTKLWHSVLHSTMGLDMALNYRTQ